MENYTYLFFDLDGTIIDSSEGVTRCFAYALKHYGIEVDDLSELYKVVGPPLKEAFMEFYGFSEEQSIEAVAKYRERYKDTGIFECRVYDGIENLLRKLKQRGYKIILATSKPKIYAERILDKFGLSCYFDFVGGADIPRDISTKEQVLDYTVESLGINELSSVLMIGDRKYDLEGARYLGIDALGVLYGFGSLDELMEYPNIGIAKSVCEIGDFLL